MGTGTGGVGSTHQGESVALSADGNTAIVGGYADNLAIGGAWVFTRSGGVWTQQGSKLLGTGFIGAARQGYSVSISSDGNEALVSGYSDNSSVGAAWVFTRSVGVWSQQGNKIVGTGAIGSSQQGYSVCLSSDGTTAIVGGWNDNSSVGAAWVYSAAPLPVELVSFTGVPTDRNVELRWQTATEVNNFGFEVERSVISNRSSVNSSSINNWSKIGFVEGGGTSNAPRAYSFIEKEVPAGKYQYRLKQIDRDGKFTFSQPVEVVIGVVPTVFTLCQNYPNPFNPTTTIEFTLPEDGRTSLRIYDVLGREQATLVNDDLKGGTQYRATFDASKLASGIYFSKLVFKEQEQIKKLLLVK